MSWVVPYRVVKRWEKLAFEHDGEVEAAQAGNYIAPGHRITG